MIQVKRVSRRNRYRNKADVIPLARSNQENFLVVFLDGKYEESFGIPSCRKSPTENPREPAPPPTGAALAATLAVAVEFDEIPELVRIILGCFITISDLNLFGFAAAATGGLRPRTFRATSRALPHKHFSPPFIRWGLHSAAITTFASHMRL
eukprot:GHVT01087649.1.p1 GENE.GHVT01087649.1~~GHVT01087649.1.p1  ORF type:complete len:152 (-),score=10.74 GHVT01087649.1:527-982(-)